jgi:hypothetical protein
LPFIGRKTSHTRKNVTRIRRNAPINAKYALKNQKYALINVKYEGINVEYESINDDNEGINAKNESDFPKNEGENPEFFLLTKRSYEEIGADRAKQQWAFEEHKRPNNVPTMADLAPHLGHHPHW